MIIADMIPCSLSDYPGKIVAVVFTQGCNYQCPFCHNGSLIPGYVSNDLLIAEEHFIEFLRYRNNQLDGVVVSGGEPTIHRELPDFLKRIKDIWYAVKLDTNGSRPKMLEKILDSKLVDYIAMDIKAPLDKYEALSGCHLTSRGIHDLKKSISLIAQSGIDHEFRTTVVEPLLTPRDMQKIRELVPDGSRYKTQRFCPEHALDPKLRKTSNTLLGEKIL
ncbi:MAG: anaerobic ribonucleoside-triphosphate reductase activating protein [Planctomycetales bacterium 4572_13]|nr:MAG: anaerobic ribonucleoside-triphosphate reductase activating protein [Planctomycetales bacterium 4572_13]